MLGIAVFHLLPHAIHELGGVRLHEVSISMMFGMIVMFFMLRFFHFHQHEPIELVEPDCAIEPVVCDHTHEHHHEHHGHHHHAHNHQGSALHWGGVLFGLGFHTLLDGVALASTMQVESHHSPNGTALWGLGVFLAILLHKPLDAISITSLMKAQGATSLQTALINIGFASMVPVGAAIVVLIGQDQSILGASLAGWGLAFSAGVFLCIALSDLLPEMEFHSHNRWQLSVALLAGIVLAWGIGFLEPAHLHSSDAHGQHPAHSTK